MPTLCVNTVLTRSPSPVSGKEHHLLGSSPVVVREGHVLMDPRVSSPGSHSEHQVLSEMLIGAGQFTSEIHLLQACL